MRAQFAVLLAAPLVLPRKHVVDRAGSSPRLRVRARESVRRDLGTYAGEAAPNRPTRRAHASEQYAPRVIVPRIARR
jgi:hypothetical protein